MIWLIKFLLFGHIHKWECISVNRLTDDVGGIGMRAVTRCEKCGAYRKWDLI